MVFRTENADKVLNIIKAIGGCHSFFIVQQTGLKPATVSAILTKLKKQRKLEKIGTGKTTMWKARKGV